MTSRDDSIGGGPSMSPPNLQEISAGGGVDVGIGDDQRWRHFDNSVNAVSFGFVATAILISMFLVMAIFERFLRPRSPFFSGTGNGVGGVPHGRRSSSSAPSAEYAVDLEAQRRNFARKLDGYPSPKVLFFVSLTSAILISLLSNLLSFNINPNYVWQCHRFRCSLFIS